MEGKNGLKVLNLQMADLVRQMEMALQTGAPVLLQDVEEEMDPILEPVLSKSFVKRGNSAVIKLGDKEVRGVREGQGGARGRRGPLHQVSGHQAGEQVSQGRTRRCKGKEGATASGPRSSSWGASVSRKDKEVQGEGGGHCIRSAVVKLGSK